MLIERLPRIDKKNVKIVLDTNVLVSALVFGGKPGIIFKNCLKKNGIIGVTSPDIIYELQTVLERPKWRALNIDVEKVVRMVVRQFFMVKLVTISPVIFQDPDDDKIIATAIAGKADFIITGDQHLLVLRQYEQIRIVTPDQFLNILQPR